MFNTCTLICVLKASVVSSTLQEENFHWNLNFAIEKFNSLNLNSIYYYIFRNLSMIAYMIKIQNSKFSNSVNLTNLSQVARLNSMMYIFIL